MLAIDPLITVLQVSNKTLHLWTVNGTVLVDDGTQYPSHSQKWHICGEASSLSSISRSFRFSDAQIAISYPTSELKVETFYRGEVLIKKYPECTRSMEKPMIDDRKSDDGQAVWKSFTENFEICGNDFLITLTIIFLNQSSCIEDVRVSLYNPWFPHY